MREKNIISVLSILILFLLNLVLINSQTCGDTRITFNQNTQEYPKIFDNIFVWEDLRSGHSEIYLYNLSSNLERKLTSGSSVEYEPRIFNYSVIFTRQGTNGYDLFLFDLLTGIEKKIGSGITNTYYEIYNNKLVFNSILAPGGIFLYNISNSVTSLINSNPGANNPFIYNNYIIYNDNRYGNQDVFLYNLTDGLETRISNSPNEEISQSIFGKYITYVRRNSFNNYSLILYDISTSNSKLIINNTQTTAGIKSILYKDKIIFHYDEGYGLNIYLYDITNTKLTKIIDGGGITLAYPSVYENKLVYQNDKAGNIDVYFYDLSSVQCNDNINCTYDGCILKTNTCSFNPITKCVNDDKCCPAGCNILMDNDCTCPVICTPGEKRCSGNINQTCQINLTGCYEFFGNNNCPIDKYCSFGNCIPCSHECSIGERGCDSLHTRKECQDPDSDNCREWVPFACNVDEKCQGGLCVPLCTDECIENTKQCSGNILQNCSKNFDSDSCTEWGTEKLCTDGCDSITKSCVSCNYNYQILKNCDISENGLMKVRYTSPNPGICPPYEADIPCEDSLSLSFFNIFNLIIAFIFIFGIYFLSKNLK